MILKTEKQGVPTDVILRKRAIPDDVLLRFSKHVMYAIESFSAYSVLAAFFGDHPKNSAMRGTDNWWKGQALLTSYLVTAREIDTFLYPEISAHLSRSGFADPTIDLGSGKNKDSVTSFDYVDDPALWMERRPRRDPYLDQIRRRINETVVHFDRSRLDDLKADGRNAESTKQVWLVAEPWNYLRPALVEFKKRLSPTNFDGELFERFQLALEGKATELDSLSSYPFLVDPDDEGFQSARE